MVQIAAMFTAALAAVVSVAAAPSASCSEAVKYGESTSLPANVTGGQSYTVSYDFSCALQRGFAPKSIQLVLTPNFAKAAAYIVGKTEVSVTTDAANVTFPITVPKVEFNPQGYTWFTWGVYDVSSEIEVFSGFGGDAVTITA